MTKERLLKDIRQELIDYKSFNKQTEHVWNQHEKDIKDIEGNNKLFKQACRTLTEQLGLIRDKQNTIRKRYSVILEGMGFVRLFSEDLNDNKFVQFLELNVFMIEFYEASK